MINRCFNCGQSNVDKIIKQNGTQIICSECGHESPFLQLPLYIVSGAGGTGKSTICYYLTGKMNNYVILDTDILWQEEFNIPENNYRKYFETWLKVAKNISQSGRPVVLFGTGFGVPDNIEHCNDRKFFKKIHYLSLYCQENELKRRLEKRQNWSLSQIENQLEFNKWFKNYDKELEPKIDLIETTDKDLVETIEEVKNWINSK